MPYGSLSKAYRTEIALGHLHANLVSLFKIRQRRLQKTKSMSGNINNRGKYKKKQYTKKKKNRDVTNGMQMKQTYRLKLLYFFICKEKKPVLRNWFTNENEFPQERDKCMFMIVKIHKCWSLCHLHAPYAEGGGVFLTLSLQLTYQIGRKKESLKGKILGFRT